MHHTSTCTPTCTINECINHAPTYTSTYTINECINHTPNMYQMMHQIHINYDSSRCINIINYTPHLCTNSLTTCLNHVPKYVPIMNQLHTSCMCQLINYLSQPCTQVCTNHASTAHLMCVPTHQIFSTMYPTCTSTIYQRHTPI